MLNYQELAGRTRSRARGLIQRLGYDMHKLRDDPDPRAVPELQPVRLPNPDESISRLIELAQARSVIDVGANLGQFASWARSTGFSGPIISFEPLPPEHQVLSEIAEPDQEWIVAPRCALGASEGSAPLHVAGNSQSSSLLDMLDLHKDNAPTSVYVESVETPIHRLDDILEEMAFDATDALLKIDTQGFEVEVLRGAPSTLAQVAAAHVEISLAPLYAGQGLASEVFAILGAAGLELATINQGFATRDGEILQIDAGFARFDAGNNR